jgi:hypothetical protein
MKFGLEAADRESGGIGPHWFLEASKANILIDLLAQLQSGSKHVKI